MFEDLDKRIEERRKRFVGFVKTYAEALDSAQREEDMQKFLSDNPELTMEVLSDGAMPLDLVSKFKLGTDYVTDFVVCGCRSFGFPYHCVFVELETPLDSGFTKKGVISAKLNTAIKQVTDWNTWLRTHSDEFCISFPKKLTNHKAPDISTDLRQAMFTFKIVIGRRAELTRDNKEYRASFFNLHNGRIEIMTYDQLLTRAQQAAGESVYEKF